jgi:hypothetical protein
MLRRMIRDGAPPEWSPLMRLVASEIADDAHDPEDGDPPLPDGTWPWSAMPIEREFRKGKWVDGLAERTGMSPRAISRTLADLAEAGYEMRKPITDRNGCPVRDKRGRLVFAAKGHALRFQVPILPPREAVQSSPDSATIQQSLPDMASFEGQRSPLLASKVAESGDPVSSVSPQLKPSPHSDQSPQTVVSLAATSVEVARAREVNIFQSSISPLVREDGEDEASWRKRTMDALMAYHQEQAAS